MEKKKCASSCGGSASCWVVTVIVLIALGVGGWFGNNFLMKKYTEAGVKIGQENVIREIVGRTYNKCEKINLFVKDDKENTAVDLINIQCVSSSSPSGETPVSPATPESISAPAAPEPVAPAPMPEPVPTPTPEPTPAP
jgi:hypothetical protein